MKNDFEMKITPCKQKNNKATRKKKKMKNITDFCTIQLTDKIAVDLELESNSVDYVNVIFLAPV